MQPTGLAARGKSPTSRFPAATSPHRLSYEVRSATVAAT